MNTQGENMAEELSGPGPMKRPGSRLKYFWRAALLGALTALSGAFAYCVFDGYVRLHQGLCDCAKYGAMVTAAFSHPIAIIGALAGVSIISAVYLVKYLIRCCSNHGRGNPKNQTMRSSG